MMIDQLDAMRLLECISHLQNAQTLANETDGMTIQGIQDRYKETLARESERILSVYDATKTEKANCRTGFNKTLRSVFDGSMSMGNSTSPFEKRLAKFKIPEELRSAKILLSRKMSLRRDRDRNMYKGYVPTPLEKEMHNNIRTNLINEFINQNPDYATNK